LINLNEDFISNFKTEEQIVIIENAINNVRNNEAYLSNYLSNSYETDRAIRRREVEWHRKFTLSIACFILFFIGAPLGAIIRKGGLGLPLVISVLFFILFYVLSILGEKFAKEGVIEVWAGMWLAPAILLPIGIFLTAKAIADSPVFDIDAWKRIFSFLIFKFKKR